MKYILLSIVLFSCASKTLPLKGSYPQTPMVFNSELSFDKAWDNLIDIFAQKGLSIKLIDRSSGLIVSEKSLMPTTAEDKDGDIYDESAFIVVPNHRVSGRLVPVTGWATGPFNKKKPMPFPVYGEWNVRLKSNGAGSTINVNITNVHYLELLSSKVQNTKSLYDYKSTGVFEKQLANLINKKS